MIGQEKRDFYTKAFIATLPAITNALFVGKGIPTLPDPYGAESETEAGEKAWDKAREIGDAIAVFTSLVAARALIKWENWMEEKNIQEAKQLFRELVVTAGKEEARKILNSLLEEGDA